MPPFYHPARRARRRVTPRAYRQVRHPVRSAAWSASGVGKRRRHSSNSTGGGWLIIAVIVACYLLAR